VGEYSRAEEEASKLINAHAVYRLTALDSVFLKNSKEAIWQLMPSYPNLYQINTPEGKGFILTNIPQTSSQATVSSQLFHCFENGDRRQTAWMSFYEDKTVKPAVRYYFPYKYKVKGGITIKEYSMLFRLAEQYLIRAEASAYLGKLQDAVSDIDVIRQRAGLTLLAHSHPGMAQMELLQAIFTERQRELFTEQAHRWLDLKRTGNINAVMDTVSPLKAGPWKTQMQYFPIPYSEILRDPSLKQNPGYP
jgi:hypothetical protein